MKTITSLDNQIIKEVVRLQKSRDRKKSGLIIVDGAREIELAVKSGLKITELFYCASLAKNVSGGAKKFFNLDQKKITIVTEKIFRQICYKENPDGFLAVAEAPQESLKDIKLSSCPLIIILEKVEKPGNLGAILRTAYAAQVDAVILNDSQTDIYNPNVIRASEGYIFLQTVVSTSREDTLRWLRDHQIAVLAAATTGSKDYSQSDLRLPVALVLGSEADGLGLDWLEAADELIKIPMPGQIDSLNVSVAAAVLIFEALRQRKEK